jgi:cytochrome c oxidase cbb3-type subunit 3
MLTPMLSIAQTSAEEAEVVEMGMIEKMMLTSDGQIMLLIGGVLLVLIILLIVMVALLAKTAALIAPPKTAEAIENSFWVKFKRKFVTGKLKPVGQEGDMMLDHNYDGIQEMDYRMPPWLSYVFLGTFVFALFYVPAFLYFDLIPDQESEYQAQLERAQQLADERAKAGIIMITAENAEYSEAEEVLLDGERIYLKNCAVCHAQDGGGGVGPNLTDNYWLHGNDIKGVFTTINDGIPEKGMIPWNGDLKPEEIQNVSNYVLSLVGTKPLNPKDPQGEFKEAAEVEFDRDSIPAEEGDIVIEDSKSI